MAYKTQKVSSNTFEIVIESLIEQGQWKNALILVKTMDKLCFKPSLQVCITLLDQLEKARQYKAAFAMYRYMVQSGYDFYENSLLNDVFKRLVSVAAKGIEAELADLMETDLQRHAGNDFNTTDFTSTDM